MSKNILHGRKDVKVDIDRPLNADVYDRGQWLVVNSKSNSGEDSVKWFKEENLETEFGFDINIMNSDNSMTPPQ